MNTLLWNIAEGVLRHVLTYGAGALVTGGYISDNEGVQAVGAVMALAAIAWSAVNKARTETRVAVALATPVPSPPGTTADDLNRAEAKRHGG